MYRYLGAAAVLAAATLTAHAHFVFVVTDPRDAGKAVVVFGALRSGIGRSPKGVR